jgi:glycosyltransferase involved in cell wall biosynthesis
LKVDLVMWTLNGEKTLPAVLNRINKVIPRELVNQKIIVDDGSKDNTISIAQKHGWVVVKNDGEGISDGANTALRLVRTEYFCSFEQDLYLSKDWWNQVSNLILNKQNVVAASGIRFLPRNNFCYSIEPYELTRKDDYNGAFGATLDNTIWNTEILRSVGGFPKLNFAGIDAYLFNIFKIKGYKWLMDYSVKSLHLHEGGMLNEFRHYYFYGLSLPQIYSRLRLFGIVYKKENLTALIIRLAKSPISSFRMALKTHDSRLMFSYPVIRLCWLLGYVKGTSWQSSGK